MAVISVIVPVYQAENTLLDCAKSILRQTFEDLELLLVEDGSTDGSGALCDRLSQEDERVRTFHKKNGGASSARNLGLCHARGKYVCFVDSDDVVDTRMLQTLLTALEKNGADTAGCGICHLRQDGAPGVTEPPVLPPGIHEKDEIMTEVVDKLLGDRLTYPVFPGYIYRFLFTREKLAGMRFHGILQEDELFLLEYMCRCRRLVTVDAPLYFYRDNDQSLVHRYLRYRPEYMDLFSAFLAEKDAVVARCQVGERVPLWRENTCWAGLLSAVANELAPGNSHSFFRQTRRLRELAQRPEMAQAVAALVPRGMRRNRRLSAALLRRRWYGVLTLLYRIKNRGRGADGP